MADILGSTDGTVAAGSTEWTASVAERPGTAVDWKEKGNAAYQGGRFRVAVVCYTHALRLVSSVQLSTDLPSLPDLAKTLLLNRSKAYEQMGFLHLAWIDIHLVLLANKNSFSRAKDWQYFGRLAERCGQLSAAEQAVSILIRMSAADSGTLRGSLESGDVIRWVTDHKRITTKITKQHEVAAKVKPMHIVNSPWTLSASQQQRVKESQISQANEFCYTTTWCPGPFELADTTTPLSSATPDISSWLHSCANRTADAAVEIRTSSLARYGMFAKRFIPAGTVFWVEKPVATGVVTTQHCDGCGKPAPSVPCSGSKRDLEPCSLIYCSQTCRQHAWKTWHAAECLHCTRLDKQRAFSSRGYSASSRLPLIIARLLARWLCTIGTITDQGVDLSKCCSRDDGMPQPSVLESNPILQQLCLPSHLATSVGAPTLVSPAARDASKPSKDLAFAHHVVTTAAGARLIAQGKYNMLQACDSYLRVLESLCLSPAWLSFSDFDYLRQVLANNVFGHSTQEERYANTIGYGVSLYEVINFVNHSCMPSASWNHDAARSGFAIQLKANVDIAADQEIFISYFDTNRPLKARQESMTQYGFLCCCALCCAQSMQHVSANNK